MAKFFYYSKSADKKPGKGSNETLGSCSAQEFADLAKIPNWRKILSNFYEAEFKYQGRTYRTAEHCFQGCKIGSVDRSLQELFALESDSDLSKGDGEAARKQRKIVVLNDDQLRIWNQLKESVLEEILSAKFSQVEIAKLVLLETKEAELWHGTRGVPKSRQYTLEKIRHILRQTSSEKKRLHDEDSDQFHSKKRRTVPTDLPC